MYCTECGAPQFEPEEQDVVLVAPGTEKSKVVIMSVDNQTTAITAIRAFTGQTLPEVRKMMENIPFDLITDLSEEEAERSAEMLRENGVDAKAVHPDRGAEAAEVAVTEPETEEIPEEPVIEAVETVQELIGEPEVIPSEEVEEIVEEIPEAEAEMEEAQEIIEEPLNDAIAAMQEFVEETKEIQEEEEYVPELTLAPDIRTDAEFLKEMEEFLNDKKDD